MLLTSVQAASICRVTRMDLHNHTRLHGIAPVKNLGRGKGGGKEWGPYAIFCLAVALSLRSRLSKGCDPWPVQRYLAELGPEGFKESILAGRRFILIANGQAMPLLVSGAALRDSDACDPIIVAGTNARVQVADLAAGWANYVGALELLRREQEKASAEAKCVARPLDIPFQVAAMNN